MILKGKARALAGRYTQQIDHFLINIGKYKPSYTLIPMPMGYNIVSTFQYYYLAPGDNGLVFPFINVVRFATITYPGGGYNTFYNVNRVNNVFDKKFPLNTLTFDTMLVQSFNVTYKRTDR